MFTRLSPLERQRNEDVFGRLALWLLRAARGWGPLGVLPDLLMRVICGAEVPRSVPVGDGFRLPHGGRGVVIHHKARIGRNVTIFHGVTIGGTHRDQNAPVIGDDVYIGTGAVILGSITVGDGARIGANAVVLKDVPPGMAAIGVPATIRQPSD